MTWVDEVRAAVGDAGPGALATGRTAARLWGIRVPTPAIDVWTPRSGPVLPGLTAVEHNGVGVVDVCTAMLLLAPIRPASDLLAACRALTIDTGEVSRRADRWIAARGPHTAAVRALLEVLEGEPVPDSGLERRLIEVLRRCGLLARASLHEKVVVGDRVYVVDFAFVNERVVIELDGWEFHRSRDAFARDRSRDVHLASSGWVVLRFTHGDVERRAPWVVTQIRRTLAQRSTTHPMRSPNL